MSTIAFISKDASWQKYRLDIFTKMGKQFGVYVTILTTGNVESYILENNFVHYKSFPNFFPGSFRFSFFPGAILYLIRHRPDVVLALPNITQLTEYCSLVICKMLGIRFLWWTHVYDHVPPKIKWLRAIKVRYLIMSFRLADGVISFSANGRLYLNRKKIPNDRIYVAPNTLDTDQLIAMYRNLQQKYSISDCIKQLGLDKKVTTFLFCGRLKKEKKLSHAIEAFARVRQAGHNIRFIIIGDGPELPKIKERAYQLGLNGNVLFPGAIYDDAKLAKWFYISDAMIVPAYAGLVIVHAFCFGLPVITTQDNTHGPEFQFIKPGINSVVVNSYSPDDLAGAMIEVTQEQKLTMLKQSALQSAQQDASVNNMIESIVHALHRN